MKRLLANLIAKSATGQNATQLQVALHQAHQLIKILRTENRRLATAHQSIIQYNRETYRNLNHTQLLSHWDYAAATAALDLNKGSHEAAQAPPKHKTRVAAYASRAREAITTGNAPAQHCYSGTPQ